MMNSVNPVFAASANSTRERKQEGGNCEFQFLQQSGGQSVPDATGYSGWNVLYVLRPSSLRCASVVMIGRS
jgi:hypothetical protein